MVTVLKNKHLCMQFDAASNFMESIWTTSLLMDDESYRQLVLSYLQQLQIYRPQRVLVDSRNAEYIITPDLQDWINVNIYPQSAAAGVRKLAFLVSNDIFVTISIEQTVEDSMANDIISTQMQQRFFDDREQALNWLLQEK
jgi:hypothetical protein